MSDRTQLAVGNKSWFVPRFVKRGYEIALATALTAGVVLLIVVTNSMLMGRGGMTQGFNLWLGFIQRPDILGIMMLTAIVTVMTLFLQRGGVVRK